MKEQEKLNYCRKCERELNNNYCSNCGSPKELKRIDKQYIITEIGDVVNFDKGIFYTIKELLIRPGDTVRAFILDDRNRLVKPIVFIIICSLIYTLFQQVLNFDDGYIKYSFGKDSAANSIFSWISENYGYANILIAVFIALWLKIFFRKDGYNYFEILILLCFVMGIGMLLFSFFGIIESLTGLKILDKGALLGILYISWAIGQFFNRNKYLNYLKAFFAYFLGVLTFTFSILLIGFLIDFFK
ncbi:MAG: hypothetical protein COA50_07250 [Flavobacteriaceae bacterium]|nr:MAG: hypothetical protein COA50_07250 [Flavobacteriaceae bacterium]